MRCIRLWWSDRHFYSFAARLSYAVLIAHTLYRFQYASDEVMVVATFQHFGDADLSPFCSALRSPVPGAAG